MSPSDQFSSPTDSSLSHLQRQQVTSVSLFQLSCVYKQATLDPVHSVSPLLLPRQQLLLSKSSPHHCLLLLDVPCPDEKILFLRLLTRPPRGRRLQLRKSALFHSHRNSITPLWCSFLLLQAWTAVWYHISKLGSDALVAWFLLLSVAQVPALASSLLPPGATVLNKLLYCSLSLC